jgi:hypothetical protein
MALTVRVPESVPPFGLLPRTSVMASVARVATLPKASWIVTRTAGLIAVPA